MGVAKLVKQRERLKWMPATKSAIVLLESPRTFGLQRRNAPTMHSAIMGSQATARKTWGFALQATARKTWGFALQVTARKTWGFALQATAGKLGALPFKPKHAKPCGFALPAKARKTLWLCPSSHGTLLTKA